MEFMCWSIANIKCRYNDETDWTNTSVILIQKNMCDIWIRRWWSVKLKSILVYTLIWCLYACSLKPSFIRIWHRIIQSSSETMRISISKFGMNEYKQTPKKKSIKSTNISKVDKNKRNEKNHLESQRNVYNYTSRRRRRKTMSMSKRKIRQKLCLSQGRSNDSKVFALSR